MSSGLLPEVSPLSPLAPFVDRARELLGQERYADAIAPITDAAALAPDNLRILTILGVLYVQSGQAREALAPLRRVIDANPGIAVAHWRLGIALQVLGESDAAAEAFEQAVRIRPGLSDAHIRLSTLYAAAGRTRDAVESLRVVARSSAEPVQQKFLEAQALEMERRESEAEPLLREALLVEPDLPGANGLLGKILLVSGRFDEAARHFRAEIAQSPRDGFQYYELVRTRKMAESDRDVMRLIETALADTALDDRNRMLVLLAQGKLLNDIGRYEEAMKALDASSELRAQVFSLDADAFERQVDDVIALFGPELFARCRPGSNDRTPVLILGMPRSGTTLTEQIISSHPDAAGTGELDFWRRRLRDVLALGPARLDSAFASAAAAEYLQSLRSRAPLAARITEKDPFNFLAVGLIHLVFPQAAIIHCRRNPLGTAISIHLTHFSRSTGLPTGGENLVRYYRAYRRLMAHWRSVLPEGRMYEMEYERLTNGPREEIPALISHLGLPWNEACLTPHVSTRMVRTPSGMQVRQCINTASVDHWRHYEPWLGPLAALREEAQTQSARPGQSNTGTSG